MAHPHVPAGLSSPTIGKRLEDIGWALFLILTGILWILPEGRVPPGTWLIGTGLLLLGLNAIRLLMRVPLSWFTTLLGGLALLAGVSTLWGGADAQSTHEAGRLGRRLVSACGPPGRDSSAFADGPGRQLMRGRWPALRLNGPSRHLPALPTRRSVP